MLNLANQLKIAVGPECTPSSAKVYAGFYLQMGIGLSLREKKMKAYKQQNVSNNLNLSSLLFDLNHD